MLVKSMHSLCDHSSEQSRDLLIAVGSDFPERIYEGRRLLALRGGGWMSNFQEKPVTGLDIGLWQPLARGASESENPLAPQKTHWPPQNHVMTQMFFAEGIYDFTREVAHFCTLGLYITKNKYELTLPSEFCRFPVKIMAAYEALKKKKNLWPLGPVVN